MKRKHDEHDPKNAAAADVPPPAHASTPPDVAPEPASPAPAADAIEPVQQLRAQVLELTAEIDNQAKRFARERQVVRDEILIRFAREMVEVLDNLDRVVQSLAEVERASPLGQGIALTQAVFLDKLAALGVERIETRGRAFDPTWHEALFESEQRDLPPGTIVNELARGFRIGSRLVRAAQVEVARAPAAAPRGDDRSAQGADDDA